MGWKPIESAPKDGTWFLAYGLGPLPCQVMQWAEYDGDGRLTWRDYNGFEYMEGPTHWMPLPDPPETAASQSQNPSNSDE